MAWTRFFINRWKAGFLLLSLLLMILASCRPAAAPATASTPLSPSAKSAEIKRRGTLVVATDPVYPPQSELFASNPRPAETRCKSNEYTSSQFEGFDIDVAKEVSRRMGVEPCFVTPTWSQIISGNWSERWDISIGSMVITEDRMKHLHFTQPYTTGEAVFFVHNDNLTYKKPSDLSGKRIGACTGCAYEAYLKGVLQIPGETFEYLVEDPIFIGYDTDTSALEDLALGDGLHLDAVLTDPDTGRTAIADGLNLKQLAEPVYRDYVAAAVDRSTSKDPTAFLQEVNQIIREMHKDGTLSKLSLQYYGVDYTDPASRFDLRSLSQ